MQLSEHGGLAAIVEEIIATSATGGFEEFLT